MSAEIEEFPKVRTNKKKKEFLLVTNHTAFSSCILKENLGSVCIHRTLYKFTNLTTTKEAHSKLHLIFTIRDDVVWYQSSCKKGKREGQLRGGMRHIPPHWTFQPYLPSNFHCLKSRLCVCCFVWCFRFLTSL